MTLEMRRTLAGESYEEKIRKVGQLIALVRAFPRRGALRSPSSATMTLSEAKFPYRTGGRGKK